MLYKIGFHDVLLFRVHGFRFQDLGCRVQVSWYQNSPGLVAVVLLGLCGILHP